MKASALVRQVIQLLSGGALSQAILLGSLPFITRIYEPQELGAYAFYLSAFALTVPFSTLKFDAAVLLVRCNRTAENVTAIALVICCIAAVIMAGLVSIWCLNRDANWELMLLVVSVPAGGIYSLLQQWSARQLNYRPYARAQVIGALTTTIIVVSPLVSDMRNDSLMLVTAHTVGLLCSACYMYANSTVRLPFAKLSLLKRKKLIKALVAYPLNYLPAQLVITLSSGGLPLLLSTVFSSQEVGIFLIAYRMIFIPSGFFGAITTELFRSYVMAKYRTHSLSLDKFSVAIFGIAVVSIGVHLVLWLVAEAAGGIFGDLYQGSSVLARAMIPLAAVQLVSNSVVYIYVCQRKNAKFLMAQILSNIVVPISLVIFSVGLKLEMISVILLASTAGVVAGLSVSTVTIIEFKTAMSRKRNGAGAKVNKDS